jgi:hypothetical protein
MPSATPITPNELAAVRRFIRMWHRAMLDGLPNDYAYMQTAIEFEREHYAFRKLRRDHGLETLTLAEWLRWIAVSSEVAA